MADVPQSAARPAATQVGGAVAHGGAEAGPKICPNCLRRYPETHRACTDDGTLLIDADDLIGVTLCGTYSVRSVIGEGSMGTVYEAQHTRIRGKRYAIKILHPEYAREPDILARFHREAEAASAIDSPHVITVIDIDKAPDGRPFLVTELLEGKELGVVLAEGGKLSLRRAVSIVRQIALGVAQAHAKGIIHRDLKPENVFLAGDLARPTAKVIDFGISRLDGRDGRALTKLGTVIGTPSFMPPEQARGERVDTRADIYSIGAILYTALTGQRPFDHDNPAQVLVKVLTEEAPTPRSLDASIPPELERIIMRAMAKDPAHRYATALEVAEALEPFEMPERAAPKSQAAPQSQERVAPPSVSRTMPDDGRATISGTPATIVPVAIIAAVWAVATLLATCGDLAATLSLSAAVTAMLCVVAVLAIAPALALFGPKLLAAARSPASSAAIAARWQRPLLAGALVHASLVAILRAVEAISGGRAPSALSLALGLVCAAAGVATALVLGR